MKRNDLDRAYEAMVLGSRLVALLVVIGVAIDAYNYYFN